MTQKIKFLTFIDLLFMLILGISGSMENGALSNTVYYLAFIIPVLIGISYIADTYEGSGISRAGTARAMLKDFGISTRAALLSLPVIAAGIGAVMLISLATSSVMELLGKENAASFTEPFILALLLHALIPAFLEELLFRFLPVNLLKNEPKTAIIASSIFFAFAHANLFQIPHAFVAGLILSSLYIATDSILPCILMHFLNNTLSLTSIYGYDGAALWITFAAIVGISLIFIIIFRNTYLKAAKKLVRGERIRLGYAPIALIAVSLTFAISALFA